MTARNTRLLSWIVAALLSAESLEAATAEAGSQAKYIGGTVSLVPEESGGRIQMTDEQSFLFQSQGRLIKVAYSQINLIEYGQKVNRRIILAILISPLFLLAKSRKHFLTLGFADDNGRQQALVFQVHKHHIRQVLVSLEAKTGVKVTYQDEEARQAGKG